MFSINIENDYLNSIVEEKIAQILTNYKREFATIDIKKLSELTGLSTSTLNKHIIYEPEIAKCRRKIGKRVLYLYPDVIEGYKAYLNRIN